MRAREIMTHPVVTVHTDTPVQRAAALLAQYGITSLPVVDEQDHVVGIVSEADLIRDRMPHDPRSHVLPAPHEQPDPSRLVRQVMTETVVCVDHAADTADLAELMLVNNVRAVPIVDGSQLVGIVSRRDLLRTLVRDDDAITAEVQQRLDDYASEPGRWSVFADGGVVTITGHFDDDAQEQIATVLTRTVPGVIRVHIRRHPAVD
jgi:CBS domain-containing protein